MRKQKFTFEEMQILQSNKNIKKITVSSVIYSDSFKKEAIELYNQGFTAVQIFENAGIDTNIIGKDNPAKILSKWRHGIGFSLNSEKLKVKSFSVDNSKTQYSDKEIKKIIARNKYLEAENDFLKKLKALEDQFR